MYLPKHCSLALPLPDARTKVWLRCGQWRNSEDNVRFRNGWLRRYPKPVKHHNSNPLVRSSRQSSDFKLGLEVIRESSATICTASILCGFWGLDFEQPTGPFTACMLMTRCTQGWTHSGPIFGYFWDCYSANFIYMSAEISWLFFFFWQPLFPLKNFKCQYLRL